MDLIGFSPAITLGLSATQGRLGNEVTALSSGLRINSAADDPSGLAVAETEHSKAAGLAAGQINLADGVSALTIGSGALQTVTAILQRIRALVVGAHNDFQSASDLAATQAEIDALLSGINHIAASAAFNGRLLFDGSFDASPAQNAKVVEIPAETPASAGAGAGGTQAVNADGNGNAGPLIANPSVGNNIPGSFVEFSVIGYDPNAVDPVLGPIGGAGVYVRVVAYGEDPTWGPQVDSITAVPTEGSSSPFLIPPYTTIQITNGTNSFVVLQGQLAGLTAADVGISIAFETYSNTPAGTGQPAAVNVGRAEGNDESVGAVELTTRALGLTGITVQIPTSGTDGNGNSVTIGSNDAAARSALARTDSALEVVGGVSAQLGAQSVSLDSASQDAAIEALNTTAAESNIRDANIPAVAWQFVRDQIQTHLQFELFAAVLADAAKSATSLTNPPKAAGKALPATVTKVA